MNLLFYFQDLNTKKSTTHTRMTNNMILVLTLFIATIHSNKVASPPSLNPRPVPPQPSQVCNLISY
jgi:hypothetical protein